MFTTTFLIFAEVLAWWCGIGLLAALLAVILGVALGEYRLTPQTQSDDTGEDGAVPAHVSR